MQFFETAETNYYKTRTWQNTTYQIDKIIIHTMDGTIGGTIAWFQKPRPDNPTSAHYLVGLDGSCVQMVRDTDTAYDAGDWMTNLTSLSIEHEDGYNPQTNPNATTSPRPDALYETSATLVAHLCQTYAIPCDRDHIKKHSEVSKLGTSCPGSLAIDRIVARAQQLLGQQPPIRTFSGTVITQNGVNIRQTPHLNGAILAKLSLGTLCHIEGVVSGDGVMGNDHWYKLAGQEAYTWAGAIRLDTQPQPATPPVGGQAPASVDPAVDRQRAGQVLQDALKNPQIVSVSGEPFGNAEGMAREMLDNWPRYLQSILAQKKAPSKLAQLLGLG